MILIRFKPNWGERGFRCRITVFMNGNQALSVNDLSLAVLFGFNQHQMKQDFLQIKEKIGAKSRPSRMPGVFSSSISVTPDFV